MNKYSNFSEEELDAEIEKKYGKDWDLYDLDDEDDLTKEFLNRISTGE